MDLPSCLCLSPKLIRTLLREAVYQLKLFKKKIFINEIII